MWSKTDGMIEERLEILKFHYKMIKSGWHRTIYFRNYSKSRKRMVNVQTYRLKGEYLLQTNFQTAESSRFRHGSMRSTTQRNVAISHRYLSAIDVENTIVSATIAGLCGCIDLQQKNHSINKSFNALTMEVNSIPLVFIVQLDALYQQLRVS